MRNFSHYQKLRLVLIITLFVIVLPSLKNPALSNNPFVNSQLEPGNEENFWFVSGNYSPNSSISADQSLDTAEKGQEQVIQNQPVITSSIESPAHNYGMDGYIRM